MITENAVDTRPKNFLTEAEVEGFLKAARKGRRGIRNFAMVLVAYRHGLRVSELVNLRIEDVDLDTGRVFVRRLKGSLSTSQPLNGDEIRALRAWLRQRINAPCCNSPLVFLSERGPMTRQAINYICAETGSRALVEKKKGKYKLRDFTARGDDDDLGLPDEDTGESRPAIDVLHRLLWLLEKKPALIADFIADANPSLDQLRLVAQALGGPALKGGEMENVSPTAEQSALGKLLANWNNIIEGKIVIHDRQVGQQQLPLR